MYIVLLEKSSFFEDTLIILYSRIYKYILMRTSGLTYVMFQKLVPIQNEFTCQNKNVNVKPCAIYKLALN